MLTLFYIFFKNMEKQLHICITGASSGIGLALMQQYIALGCKVSVCARQINELQNLVQNNTNVIIISADVSVENDCKHFIESAIAQNGEIDVLINNAGISMRAMFAGIDLQVLHKLMNINFWGAVHCTHFALPSIIKTKGVVCSTSSIAGYRGLPARSGYSSSKFALQGFMESLRTEMLHTGVHIMWVSPGFTASNIRNMAINAAGIAQGETPLQENKLMSADQCATIMITAIANRKRTVVMTLQGKVTVWLNKLFPSLADKLVFNHFAKEIDSPLRK
jgi:short-subunit dehydrogenase